MQTDRIYRVEGVYNSGRYVSHLVGARDAMRAIMNVTEIDNPIIRVTSALPVSLD